MNEAIIVALITAAATIIVALIGRREGDRRERDARVSHETRPPQFAPIQPDLTESPLDQISQPIPTSPTTTRTAEKFPSDDYFVDLAAKIEMIKRGDDEVDLEIR
jgi:hypothetical protein